MTNPIIARLERALIQNHLPGVAVVIRQRDEDVFAGGVGCFDAQGHCQINEQTQFGVASLSKLVTTMLVLLLQERGDLSVDDSLVQYFPSLRVAQQAPISLAHLLSHSAGFPGLPGRFYARNVDDIHDRSGGVGSRGGSSSKNENVALPDFPTILDATELVSLLNQLDIELLAPPGELLNYSNEGFCLLGGVIEQVTQRPYAQLVQEMIFTPLRMNDSHVGKIASSSTTAIALPLLRDGSGGYNKTGFWQAPLFYPAGGCISSARDIARLIGSLSDTESLLGLASKQLMALQQMSVASRPMPGIGYGLGLEFEKIDPNTTLLWHSGQRAGVSSFMGWLIEEQMSLSVLCNVADAPVTSIAHELIGDVLNRSDFSWPPFALTKPVHTSGFERFVGRYASEEGNCYVVEQTEHGLGLSSSGAPDSQRFTFAGTDHGTMGPHTFRFLSATSQAQSWALALDLRVLRRTA